MLNRWYGHCLDLAPTPKNCPCNAEGVKDRHGKLSPDPKAWGPGVGHDVDSFRFESSFGEQVSEQLRRPCVEVVVDVARVVTPLRPPVIDWPDHNEPTSCLKDRTDAPQFVQRTSRVLKSVIGDDDIHAGWRHPSYGWECLDPVLAGNLQGSLIGIDPQASSALECDQRESTSTPEVKHCVASSNELPEFPSIYGAHSGRQSKLPLGIARTLLAQVVRRDGGIRHGRILGRAAFTGAAFSYASRRASDPPRAYGWRAARYRSVFLERDRVVNGMGADYVKRWDDRNLAASVSGHRFEGRGCTSSGIRS
jgi:hypothetical protein